MERKDEETKELLIRHYTNLDGLFNILLSGMLLSPERLQKESSGINNNIIFFTPLTSSIIDFDNNDFSIYLDFHSTIDKYNKFFINSGNQYGPLNGNVNKKNNCLCVETFNNNLEEYGYPNISNRICYRDLHTMTNLILSLPQNMDLFEYCDGGPELGIFSPEIELNNLLKFTVVKNREKLLYNKNIQHYLRINNLTIDTIYDRIKIMTENLGGIFIEKNKNARGIQKKHNKYRKYTKHNKYIKQKKYTKRNKHYKHSNHSKHSKHSKRKKRNKYN